MNSGKGLLGDGLKPQERNSQQNPVDPATGKSVVSLGRKAWRKVAANC